MRSRIMRPSLAEGHFLGRTHLGTGSRRGVGCELVELEVVVIRDCLVYTGGREAVDVEGLRLLRRLPRISEIATC
jgi:hypothetical protein